MAETNTFKGTAEGVNLTPPWDGACPAEFFADLKPQGATHNDDNDNGIVDTGDSFSYSDGQAKRNVITGVNLASKACVKLYPQDQTTVVILNRTCDNFRSRCGSPVYHYN